MKLCGRYAKICPREIITYNYYTSYLSHPEILIRKPSSKILRIHQIFRSVEFLGNFVFPDKNYVQKLYQIMIRRLQLLIRNVVSLIQRKMLDFRMTEAGRYYTITTSLTSMEICEIYEIYESCLLINNLSSREFRYLYLFNCFLCVTSERLAVSVSYSLIVEGEEDLALERVDVCGFDFPFALW